MRDIRLVITGSQRLTAVLALLGLLGGSAALGGGGVTSGATPDGGAAGGGGVPSPGAAAHTGDTAARAGAPAGNAQRGKRLYLAVGCYECHGTTGAGAATTGPQIAPNPVPFPAFIYQLRHPLGSPPYGNIKMPRYGETVLSGSQAADIYAYLSSIGPSPPASKIPLLNP